MKKLIIPLILLLPACDAASPAFRDAQAVKRTVAGSEFTLRFRDQTVEAIRTNAEFLPKYEEIATKAARAAEAERPDCKVAWVEGDPAMMLLGLKCPGHPVPPRPKRPKTMVCDISDIDLELGYLECEQF